MSLLISVKDVKFQYCRLGNYFLQALATLKSPPPDAPTLTIYGVVALCRKSITISGSMLILLLSFSLPWSFCHEFGITLADICTFGVSFFPDYKIKSCIAVPNIAAFGYYIMNYIGVFKTRLYCRKRCVWHV